MRLILFFLVMLVAAAHAQVPIDPITGQPIIKPLGVPMPEVRGLTMLEAQRRLRDAGIQSETVLEVQAPDSVGLVVRQTPVAGSYIHEDRPTLEIGVEAVSSSAPMEPTEPQTDRAARRSVWPWLLLVVGSAAMGWLGWLGWQRWRPEVVEEKPSVLVMKRRRTRK